MYFWRIEVLKSELRAGPMPAGQVLPYILWCAIIVTVATQLPLFIRLPAANEWDVVILVSTVVLTFGGLLAAYYANGGPQGFDFATRLVALAWVVGWRLIPALIVLILMLLVATAALAPEQFTSDDAPTTPLFAGVMVLYELLYYWRLWAHLRDVAAPGPGPAGSASAPDAA